MNARENKQLIQKVLADFVDGNVDTFLNALAEDVVFELPKIPADVPKVRRVYRGREETLELLNIIGELNDTLVFEPREFIAEGDKVVVLLYEKVRVKATDREFEQDFVQIWTMRDGQIVRCKIVEDTYAIWEAHTN